MRQIYFIKLLAISLLQSLMKSLFRLPCIRIRRVIDHLGVSAHKPGFIKGYSNRSIIIDDTFQFLKLFKSDKSGVELGPVIINGQSYCGIAKTKSGIKSLILSIVIWDLNFRRCCSCSAAECLPAAMHPDPQNRRSSGRPRS